MSSRVITLLLVALSLVLAPLRARALTGAERLRRYGFTLEEFLAADEARRDEIRLYVEAREAAEAGALAAVPELPDLEGTAAASNSFFDGSSAKWGLSGGALAPGPMLSRSPFVTLDGELSGSGRRVDYLLSGRIGAVDLGARFMPPSPYDPLVEDDGSAWSSRNLYVGSLLLQVGRAFPLFGPFDVGVGALGLVRVVDAFPNATTDESAALRMYLGGGHSLAFFTGLTQSLALLSEDWAARSLAGKGMADPHTQSSPHTGASLWGPMSGGGRYSVMARRQNNELTTEDSVAGEVAWPLREGMVSLFGRNERRSGAEIEYERRKQSLGIGYETRDGVRVTLESTHDAASFGGAQAENRSLMLGLSWSWEKKSLSLRSPVSSRSSDDTPGLAGAKVVGEVDLGLAALDGLLSRAQGLLSGHSDAQLWLAFQVYCKQLTPDQRASIEAELGPGGLHDAFNQGLDWVRSDEGHARLEALRAMLLDPERLDRILIGSLRGYAARRLSETGVTGLGGRVQLDPPAMLALLNAYSLGADPIPAIRARDVQGGTVRLSAELMAQIPPERRAQLEAFVGPGQLQEMVGAAAVVLTDVIRRELNDIILQAMLSAESLDEVSVDRGLRPGELNAGAIQGSFARLDERRAASAAAESELPRRQVLAKAVERLRAERDEAGRLAGEILLARARGLAARLGRRGVTAPAQDWVPMLAVYGEAELEATLLEASQLLANGGPARLMVDFSPDSDMGPSIVRGVPARVGLPGDLRGRSPESVLRALLTVLRVSSGSSRA